MWIFGSKNSQIVRPRPMNSDAGENNMGIGGSHPNGAPTREGLRSQGDENSPPFTTSRPLSFLFDNIPPENHLEERLRRAEQELKELRREVREKYMTKEQGLRMANSLDEKIEQIGRISEARDIDMGKELLNTMKLVRKLHEDIGKSGRERDRTIYKSPRATCRMCKKELSRSYMEKHMRDHCPKIKEEAKKEDMK